MKRKELAQMREKGVPELMKVVGEKRKEVVEVYGKMVTGREKNLKKVKNLKRGIAQILGIIKEKEVKK